MRALRSVNKTKPLEVSFTNHHRRGARVALSPQIPLILLEKRKPEKILPVASTTNEADEALYRWFPSVTQPNATASTAQASLDATFETLHPNFAKRWAPSPDATAPSCLNGGTNSETTNKCLTSSSNSNNRRTERRARDDNKNGPTSSQAEAEGGAKGSAGVPLNGHAQAASTSQLLFLVRHGQTDMNAAGKLQGRGVNAHLNAAGLSQAEGLGRFVRNVPFDTVTASSLHRAHEVRRQYCCNCVFSPSPALLFPEAGGHENRTLPC